MSVLTAYFDSSVNQFSPSRTDVVRVVKYDSKGEEHVSYEDFDSLSYQKSLGTLFDWDLSNLLKAGINPNFPIHTGYNTRLAGIDDLARISAFVDNLFESDESVESVESDK